MASQRDGGIAWCDRTWNPVTGCTKVSAGCKHCYAEVMAKRTFGRLYDLVHDGYKEGGGKFYRTRRFTDVQCHPDRLNAPMRWRKPARVFVNSMSDLFHEDVPNAFIDQAFAVMSLSKRHTFQVLTKRPERMLAYFTKPGSMCSREADVNCAIWSQLGTKRGSTIEHGGEWRCGWPLSNVWLGVSVEDQATADARIPLLLQTPASVRFVSYEPAVGLVDFGRAGALPVFRYADAPIEIVDGLTQRVIGVDPALSGTWGKHDATPHPWIDWLIVGGESGPKARPCYVAWIRSVVAQCKAAGVACFVKQLGAASIACDADSVRDDVWRAMEADDIDAAESFPLCVRYTDRKGGDPAEWPEDLRVREMPEVRS